MPHIAFLPLFAHLLLSFMPVPGGEVALREGWWVHAVPKDEAGRTRLLERAEARGVNTLYLHVYAPAPNAAGRRMQDERRLAAFLRAARRRGVEVWAAYGAPDWPSHGCSPGGFPHARLMEVAHFNRIHPGAGFAGVMLDVEPDEPADVEALRRFFVSAAGCLRAEGLPVAAAVRFFWAADPAPSLLDAGLDHVVVMAYRNRAGGACPDDGFVCLAEAFLDAAERRGLDRHVVLGLRDTSVEQDGGRASETFHHLAPEAQHRARTRARRTLGAFRSFGGYAVHAYAEH